MKPNGSIEPGDGMGMNSRSCLALNCEADDCNVFGFGEPVCADPPPTTADEAIAAHHACERARMKERDEKAHLLDWAESLLCNALPMPHCAQEEWDVAVKNWRAEKHGVKKPNASGQAHEE